MNPDRQTTPPPGNHSKPAISLVVAVYDKPEALRLVLAACARQSIGEFEVIIADDGSGEPVETIEISMDTLTKKIREIEAKKGDKQIAKYQMMRDIREVLTKKQRTKVREIMQKKKSRKK